MQQSGRNYRRKFLLLFFLVIFRLNDLQSPIGCTGSLSYPTINNHPTPQLKLKTYGLKLSQSLNVIKNVFNTFASQILLLAGDIELNPGPVCVYKKTTELFRSNHNKLKFFHVNCHSVDSKKKQVENIIEDLGNNTVYGFCETWLKEGDSEDYWQLKKDLFKTFRSDRKIATKKKVLKMDRTRICP